MSIIFFLRPWKFGSTKEAAKLDMHDFVPKKRKRKKKNEEERLIRRGIGQLRFHPKKAPKYDFKGTIEKRLRGELRDFYPDLSSEEEEIIIMLLMTDEI